VVAEPGVAVSEVDASAAVEVDDVVDDDPPERTTPVTPPTTARATTAAMTRDRSERRNFGSASCGPDASATGGGKGTPSGGLGGISRHVRGRGSAEDG